MTKTWFLKSFDFYFDSVAPRHARIEREWGYFVARKPYNITCNVMGSEPSPYIKILLNHKALKLVNVSILQKEKNSFQMVNIDWIALDFNSLSFPILFCWALYKVLLGFFQFVECIKSHFTLCLRHYWKDNYYVKKNVMNIDFFTRRYWYLTIECSLLYF